MSPQEIKTHACAFADWNKEQGYIESNEFRRIVKKLGGMPTVASPTTEERYLHWINRTKMTFDEAVALAKLGESITRPRLWAVHRGYIRLKNGELSLFSVEYNPVGVKYHPEYESSDQAADDWLVLTTQMP